MPVESQQTMCGCRLSAAALWSDRPGSATNPKEPDPSCPFCDGTGTLKRTEPMPVTPFAPVAFRCKNCGRLHEAGHAGDADHPHACRVCGAGVSFDPRTGQKTIDPANWEVLASAPPERLKELGLSPEHVEQHTPHQKPVPDDDGWRPGRVDAGAADGPRSQDRP